MGGALTSSYAPPVARISRDTERRHIAADRASVAFDSTQYEDILRELDGQLHVETNRLEVELKMRCDSPVGGERDNLDHSERGKMMSVVVSALAVGAGVLGLAAVDVLIFGEPLREWFKPQPILTFAGVVAGFLVLRWQLATQHRNTLRVNRGES